MSMAYLCWPLPLYKRASLTSRISNILSGRISEDVTMSQSYFLIALHTEFLTDRISGNNSDKINSILLGLISEIITVHLVIFRVGRYLLYKRSS